MDLFELLKDDHQKVKQVLDRLEESSPRATKSRNSGLERLWALFVPHRMAEEETFYPALVDAGQDDLALAALEEHRVAMSVLEDLDELDAADARWTARLKLLSELIRHHIEEEESDIFKAARESIDDERLSQLGKDFQEHKRLAKKHAA